MLQKTFSNIQNGPILNFAWSQSLDRGYFMKGTINASAGAICLKCGKSSFKVKLNEDLEIKLPVCSDCGGRPDKYRVRKVIPSESGKGIRKDFYRNLENNLIKTIPEAIAVLGNVTDRLSTGTYRPEEYLGSDQSLVWVRNLLNDYLVANIYRLRLKGESEEKRIKMVYKIIKEYKLKDNFSPIELSNFQNTSISASTILVKLRFGLKKILPFFGEKDIKHINKGCIMAFYHSIEGNTQPKLAVDELKCFMKYAHQKSLINFLPPFPSVKRVRKKKESDIPPIEIQRRIINAIENPKIRLIYILCASCPERTCEAVAHKVKDIDFERRLIHTRGHIEKGPKGIGLIWSEGRKSNQDGQEFETMQHKLNDYLIEELKPYVEGRNPEEFLFTSHIHKDKFISMGSCWDNWQKALRSLNLEKRYKPHETTKATTLFTASKNGASDKHLMSMAGNSDLATLKKHYVPDLRIVTDVQTDGFNKTESA